MNWFVVKIEIERPEGKENNQYLIEGVTFTDIEVKVNEIFKNYAFKIKDIQALKVAEVFFDYKSERFYKSKIGYFSIDVKKDVEKKSYSNILIQADSFKEAFDIINEEYAKMAVDYEIAMIQETRIVEILTNDSVISK